MPRIGQEICQDPSPIFPSGVLASDRDVEHAANCTDMDPPPRLSNYLPAIRCSRALPRKAWPGKAFLSCRSSDNIRGGDPGEAVHTL